MESGIAVILSAAIGIGVPPWPQLPDATTCQRNYELSKRMHETLANMARWEPDSRKAWELAQETEHMLWRREAWEKAWAVQSAEPLGQSAADAGDALRELIGVTCFDAGLLPEVDR